VPATPTARGVSPALTLTRHLCPRCNTRAGSGTPVHFRKRMRLEKAQTSERFRPRSDVRSTFRIGGAAHLTSLDRRKDTNPAGHSGPDRAKGLCGGQNCPPIHSTSSHGWANLPTLRMTTWHFETMAERMRLKSNLLRHVSH
jgi:hypothetical protein